VTQAPAGAPDRFAAARAVADAVLYEGYVLYPYRASAAKNQLRWQFGVLAPPAFSQADGSERWYTRTECLLEAGLAATLHVRVRGLHLQRRTVESPSGERVGATEVDGRRLVDWDEAVEAAVDLPPLGLGRAEVGFESDFVLGAACEVEEVADSTGALRACLVRRREEVCGRVRVAVGLGRYRRVSIVVENTSTAAAVGLTRDTALARSLLAVHTMLAVDGGRFVSLLDPPPDAADAAAACRSEGSYPVLIGDGDVVLASPIILYDRPEVAPESPGDLYDATEIDEILALRVLTLTDEEKAEARATDGRAAAVIDRCDQLPPEVWRRLHGAVRSLTPPPARQPTPSSVSALMSTAGAAEAGVPWWDPGADGSVDPGSDSVTVAGVELRRGRRVRLAPSRRADAQDLFLRDRTAVVAGVFHDVDGNDHVAVTLADDPAAAELEWQGRYLYFHPDELEPL
jgi:hypothetical protein